MPCNNAPYSIVTIQVFRIESSRRIVILQLTKQQSNEYDDGATHRETWYRGLLSWVGGRLGMTLEAEPIPPARPQIDRRLFNIAVFLILCDHAR